MALALRLDDIPPAATAAGTAGARAEGGPGRQARGEAPNPSRLNVLLRLLAENGGAYMCAKEYKESGQVHWQALLYTDADAQSFRDVFRNELKCKKTEYSVVKAPKPEGFERYLCKGPHGKHGQLPEIVGSYGVKYTPVYFAQCHERWYAHGQKIRSEKRGRAQEKANFMQLCEQAMQSKSVEFTLGNCVRTVLSSALRLRKMYSKQQLIWTAQMMYANANPSAETELMALMVAEAQQQFSEPLVRSTDCKQSPYPNHATVEAPTGDDLDRSPSCGSSQCGSEYIEECPEEECETQGVQEPHQDCHEAQQVPDRGCHQPVQSVDVCQGSPSAAGPSRSVEAVEPECSIQRILPSELHTVCRNVRSGVPGQHQYHHHHGSAVSPTASVRADCVSECGERHEGGSEHRLVPQVFQPHGHGDSVVGELGYNAS